MQVPFLIVLVFLCLVTVSGLGAPKVHSSIKAKWQQLRSRGGGGGRGAGAGDQNSGLKTTALRMANGVKSNVRRQATRLATAAGRGLSGAKNRLKSRKAPENDLNEVKFKALEDKMISYLATNPDPEVFHLDLFNFAMTKAMRNPKNDKLDIPETVTLNTDPTNRVDPTDHYMLNHDCNEICLKAYGYLFKSTAEKGATQSEQARFADGTVTPVTRGRVKYSWWSGTRQFMRNRKYAPYKCTCETRDDFLNLLKEFDIDPNPFQFLKKLSSLHALMYLSRKLENIDGSLLWLDRLAFTQIFLREMVAHGLKPLPEMTEDSKRVEEFREKAGIDTEKADDSYWEEMKFYRPSRPKSTVNLPSPSVIEELRNEKKSRVLQ